MFRASRITLRGWEDSWAKLLPSLDHLSIPESHSHTYSNACWDSAPIVARLFCAFNGFRDDYLQIMPPHILRRVEGSFPCIPHLRPDGPVRMPAQVAPQTDPIFKQLVGILKTTKGKPQKEAFLVFHTIVRSSPFPPLLFKRAGRWAAKYFDYEIAYITIVDVLQTLKACKSPFFSSLVIRTLAYAWSTGVRFSNCVSDLRPCPFCPHGPESLPHIISCPCLLAPLRVSLNKVLVSKAVNFSIPEPNFSNRSHIFSCLLPYSPISAAHLLLIAGACDSFHASRFLHFCSGEARDAFINDRVNILCDKPGKKFWKNIHAELPPTPIAPRRKRSSRRLRPRPFLLVSSPPSSLGTEEIRGTLGGPCSQHRYSDQHSSIKHPHVHTCYLSRPLSFSFVPFNCFIYAASLALAPWFSGFFIQLHPPLFSLSFGFPFPLALRLFSWTQCPCPFTLYLSSLPLFLWAWPDMNAFRLVFAATVRLDIRRLQSRSSWLFKFLLGRALGSNGSCLPHASINFTSGLQEFHRFCCLIIFPLLWRGSLAPGFWLSSAFSFIFANKTWLPRLQSHSPLLSYLVPGSLSKAIISIAKLIDVPSYSRGARQCGQLLLSAPSWEECFFFLETTPCVKGCVFKCSPFSEGCVGTGELLPAPIQVPYFKRPLIYFQPSSSVSWLASRIAMHYDLIYSTFLFGNSSGFSLLATCFQIPASSPFEDIYQIVSVFGVPHRVVDGWFFWVRPRIFCIADPRSPR